MQLKASSPHSEQDQIIVMSRSASKMHFRASAFEFYPILVSVRFCPCLACTTHVEYASSEDRLAHCLIILPNPNPPLVLAEPVAYYLFTSYERYQRSANALDSLIRNVTTDSFSPTRGKNKFKSCHRYKKNIRGELPWGSN